MYRIRRERQKGGIRRERDRKGESEERDRKGDTTDHDGPRHYRLFKLYADADLHSIFFVIDRGIRFSPKRR